VKAPVIPIRSDRGFTLIEVLVSLLVLSISVVAVLQLFGAGLRLARASGDHIDAVMVAEARMAEIAGETLTEGVTEGTEGAYRWTRRVALDPSLLPENEDSETVSPIKLARVTVEVRWGRNRLVELVTIRPLSEEPES
jgi:prepilin-type N-terminal cleavage/methylation domain-containing protein